MTLKFNDLNFKTLSINKTMDEHGKRELGTLKTRTSIRNIKIDNKLNKDLMN